MLKFGERLIDVYGSCPFEEHSESSVDLEHRNGDSRWEAACQPCLQVRCADMEWTQSSNSPQIAFNPQPKAKLETSECLVIQGYRTDAGETRGAVSKAVGEHSLPSMPQDTGELVTELSPERVESSFSCELAFAAIQEVVCIRLHRPHDGKLQV